MSTYTSSSTILPAKMQAFATALAVNPEFAAFLSQIIHFSWYLLIRQKGNVLHTCMSAFQKFRQK